MVVVVVVEHEECATDGALIAIVISLDGEQGLVQVEVVGVDSPIKHKCYNLKEEEEISPTIEKNAPKIWEKELNFLSIEIKLEPFYGIKIDCLTGTGDTCGTSLVCASVPSGPTSPDFEQKQYGS